MNEDDAKEYIKVVEELTFGYVFNVCKWY
jgi:hypothetical protein